VVRVERVSGAALNTQQSGGGGGGAAGGLTDNLLRPVLEAAIAAAREGEEETPSVPAPAPLRPYLRFAKLPRPALAATRRVLDSDEEFRARVAEAAKEESVGRAGWLFLSRPEGWEEELAALVAAALEEAGQEADRRAEHDARRRLAGAEEAVRRAEQAVESARREAAEAVAALAYERRARLAAAAEAAAAQQRVESLAAERERVRASAAAAAGETGILRRRVTELEARVKELEAELAETAAASAAAMGAAAEATEAGTSTGTGVSGTSPITTGAGEPVGGLSVETAADIGRALGDAAAAAGRLAEALAAAATPLRPAAPVTSEQAALEVAEATAPTDRRVLPVGRRPVALPPAIFDDSLEAADHLVRVNGVALVVDGYNVSQTGWPDLPIAEQRRRLVSALGELAARTGADVRVIFDGADLAMPGAVPTTSQLVRVTFSPPGVEADDEVLAMVNGLPAHRAVVVATSDRAVQQGASRVGANVITAPQLIALLRR
jgi:predicted RNA-binding protein with PIN domain